MTGTPNFSIKWQGDPWHGLCSLITDRMVSESICNSYYSLPQYNTIQCNTIKYNTIQYNTIQYNTIQYNTIKYNTIQCNKWWFRQVFTCFFRYHGPTYKHTSIQVPPPQYFSIFWAYKIYVNHFYKKTILELCLIFTCNLMSVSELFFFNKKNIWYNSFAPSLLPFFASRASFFLPFWYYLD
jgi:hypothetical protein